MSNCEATASDLTQQTFYVWATKGHQLKDPTRAKSWLFTTLHREFLHSRRRNRNHPHVDLEVAGAELPEVQPEVIRHASVAEVLHAFERLGEPYRAPLSLFHVEGLSYREIAKILNTPVGTVMSQISRGRRKVLQILQEHTSREGERAVVPFKQGKSL